MTTYPGGAIPTIPRYVDRLDDFNWAIRSAEDLRAWRTDRGLTQELVAKAIGVKRNSVNRWECGERTPRSPNFRSLTLVLRTIDQTLAIMDAWGIERP